MVTVSPDLEKRNEKPHAPHGEQVRNDDPVHHQQTTRSEPLHSSTNDQSRDVPRHAADQASDEENTNGSEQDGLAAPDVAEFSPERCRGCLRKQVRRADPGEAGRGAQALGNGGERGRDDGDVEGGEEDGELGEVMVR